MSLENEFEEQHILDMLRIIGGTPRLRGPRRVGRIDEIFRRAAKNIVRDIARFKLKHPPSTYSGGFYAKHGRIAEQIARTLKGFEAELYTTIEDAVVSQWNLGNERWDELLKAKTRNLKVPSALSRSMYQVNIGALNSFLDRTEGGMKLSSRVWKNVVSGVNEQLETYMGAGIATGKSAAEISRDVRMMLNEPDRLYRRIRDKETGELRLSGPAREYHPGRGVYRSAFKNALRMTATETNMAYRASDSERRSQLPFVYGIEVHLSLSHPRYDICDPLTGEYPRSFVFLGWHPWCLCYTTAILPDKDSFVRYVQTGDLDRRKYIKAIPQSAQAYMKSHKSEIQGWKTQPAFVEKNLTKNLTLRKSVAKPPSPAKLKAHTT